MHAESSGDHSQQPLLKYRINGLHRLLECTHCLQGEASKPMIRLSDPRTPHAPARHAHAQG